MSVATYDWADEQYIRMGMNPRDASFIWYHAVAGTCCHISTQTIRYCQDVLKTMRVCVVLWTNSVKNPMNFRLGYRKYFSSLA
eukprot:SAG31_NODE_31235_length_370_cov_1.103321_1_plen_82_part_01